MQDTSIVLLPAPGMGHMISMVELGKLILHHYAQKFSITIIYTTGSVLDSPSITSYIHRVSQSNPSISFHPLPSVSVDTAPTRSLPAKAFEFMRLSLAKYAPQALQQISNSSNIRAVIIDLFCTTALPIAKDLNLPVYYFYSSGAYALAAFLYFPKIHDQTNKSFKDLTTTELHFPGISSPLKATHMPEPTLDRDDPAYWDMLYFCSHLPKSNGIIANTFEDLEPKALKAIADGVCVPYSPTPPVYCIGPLIADAEERAGEDGNECLSWLDSQPSRSVVFLCFGSLGSFSAAQVKEIAHGLERSGQRFFWVLKKPTRDQKTKHIEKSTAEFDLEGVLPKGFMERTKDRGMVVKKWAPQVAVLRKQAVGGFVTHCGWNSVLEAVVAGVPMVAWPLYAEQHLNRNILVNDMKMAIDLEQREDDGFVSGDELERRIRELMESEQGRELRGKSWKMREMALAALGSASGSSTRVLAKFVEAL
ncbi:UDP-glycosyltransferase 88F3-like [Corylus avellana]|uniref:UDP-glycosyltransferase 88F3-like n=1 Tax=Corylus avellana TaxID=13451 RepID=UPI001E1FC60E|nr:UDP-glycosyltransferase 88F3-like [Corylus avellana]